MLPLDPRAHRPDPPRARVPRLATVAVLVAVLATGAAACGATPPSASPSPTASPPPGTPAAPTPTVDPAVIYAEINAQVRAIRGLDERSPVEPTIVSPDEMGEIVGRSFREDSPADLVAAYDRLYKGLGLLAPDEDLGDTFVELLESQVAGLYDPSSESLYVVSQEGGIGAVEKVYYSHEYNHALQDQHFDLEQLQDGLLDQTDTQLARLALAEGDAYVLMTHWLQRHLTPIELAQVLAAGVDPDAQAALEDIPPIVQAQILFAALEGTQWLLQIQLAGGWEAVDAIWADPPASTEQILHPEKWQTREAPIPVDVPDDLAARLGAGWSVGLEDTMGEHQTSIWLGEDDAEAAVGWGGDRLALLDGPDGGWAIAWRTAWDTEDDAAEFEDAALRVIRAGDASADVVPAPGGDEVWLIFASDDAILGQLAGGLRLEAG